MCKFLRLPMIAILLLMSLSCGKKAPECSDKQTRNKVIEIVTGRVSEIVGAGNMDGTSFDIVNVRTSSFDKSVGKYACAADLNTVAYEGNQTNPITYSSEPVKDAKNGFVVNVSGLDNAVAFIKPPIPNTRDAWLDVADAAIKRDTEKGRMEPDLSPEEKGKWLVEMYREKYNRAGYNFDRSVCHLASELEKDPNYISAGVRNYTMLDFSRKEDVPGGAMTWIEVSILAWQEQDQNPRDSVKSGHLLSKRTNGCIDRIIHKLGHVKGINPRD